MQVDEIVNGKVLGRGGSRLKTLLPYSNTTLQTVSMAILCLTVINWIFNRYITLVCNTVSEIQYSIYSIDVLIFV